jgi:PPP family 3-phenylpropionic acid transporter
VLTIISINLMPNAPKQEPVQKTEGDQPEQSISVLQFFGKYPKTVPVIAALVLLYFCHNVFNTYLGAVLGDIMKGSTDEQIAAVQGNALFIQAMVELPTMFGFALILKRLSVNQVMAISGIFYSIKHVVLLLASNIPMFYAGMILQMFSFAALTPAIVYFANEQVNEEDRNKSQAVFATANTVGGLLASFVGGWMFQLLSVHAGLTVSVVASVAGTALMLLATMRLGLGKKLQA